jgi:hypothetical protein
MSVPTECTDKWREANKDLATKWLEQVAADLTDEESTKALAYLVCWIALVGGQVALLDLIKELTRRI